MIPRSRRQLVYQRFPASQRVEITAGADRLAHDRTAHLYRHVEMPINDLLAYAYLQGINDAVQVIEKTGWSPAP